MFRRMLWPDFGKKRCEGACLKDSVYGASDGIVTTFAIVAGVSGASLTPSIILILGFANLIADGLSMAAGHFLGSKSEEEVLNNRKKEIFLELKKNPKKYHAKLKNILKKKGFEAKTLRNAAKTIETHKHVLAETILLEKGFEIKNDNAIKGALITFVSFVVAGFMPLLAYILSIFLGLLDVNTFEIAIFITALTLFTVGILKSSITKESWWKEGFQMLIIGGGAAAVAYFVGYGLSLLV